ncbi:MAG: PhzF family phenazine biosynthesis protein [Bdellovibrionales bacterium]
MRKSTPYFVANAFAPRPFAGNPAGVFPCADELTTSQMQAIAKQLNLVETVFVSSPQTEGVDFEVRYFTPEKELPLAGHPTIAAWHILATQGFLPNEARSVFRQHTPKGIQEIKLERTGQQIRVVMQQEQPQFYGIYEDKAGVAEVFSLEEGDLLEAYPVESVDTGLGHIIFGVKDLASLMKVRRNIGPLKKLCTSMQASEAQIFCSETYDPSLTLHTRNICPREGMEDPACGVGNSALLAYLMKNGFFKSNESEMLAEQGHIEDRPSVIYVKGRKTPDSYELELGGSAITMSKGEFLL